MEQVKLPQIKVKIRTLSDTPSNEEKQWLQVNPSCLLAYLGIRGYANTPKSGEAVVSKNAQPILTYFDIFKNYYANTQEKNFYMIGGSPVFYVQINEKDIPDNDNIPSALGEITKTSSITLSPPMLTKEEVRLRVKTSINAKEQILTADQIGTWTPSAQSIKIDTTKVLSTWYITAIYSTKRTSLEKYPLENLDTIRDKILLSFLILKCLKSVP